jgi:hypothetical protein
MKRRTTMTDSDNDLEIVSEQSGTADSTDDASGGTEAPVKKAKIILTEEQETFAKKFQPAPSRGLGAWYLYEIALWMHAGNLLSPGFRNRFKCHLLHSNRDGFRNRLKCHLLQSIIL